MDDRLLARRDRLRRLVTRLLGLGQVAANANGRPCALPHSSALLGYTTKYRSVGASSAIE
jgi:hypothetical protein